MIYFLWQEGLGACKIMSVMTQVRAAPYSV